MLSVSVSCTRHHSKWDDDATDAASLYAYYFWHTMKVCLPMFQLSFKLVSCVTSR